MRKSEKLGLILESYFVKEGILLVLFLLFVFQFQWFERGLIMVLGQPKKGVEWTPLYVLAFQYLAIVAVSSSISFAIAFSLGIMTHLFKLESLKSLMLSLANFGTTFPSIAVIALLVPIFGYGYMPVVIALVIYGILPILMNTLIGLDQVDPSIVEASIGMGMKRHEALLRVYLPIAMPVILAGVKTSLIINIAAATVGAVVGAGGLGMPIVSGIRTSEPILIIKGAFPVILLALFVDGLFNRIERKYQWNI